MIICAAIKLTHRTSGVEMIICGHRHRSCYAVISQLNDDWNLAKKEEGFINHYGVFIDRVKAYREAETCGQINAHNQWYRKDNKVPDELYSEDLY